MIIGKIRKNDKIKKFSLDLQCTMCGVNVPGGMKTSEEFYNTGLFHIEVESFRKNYLCGKCRDKKRIFEKSDFK